MVEEGKPRVFGFCKTNYKPYDIAVTAFLIILKEHFKDKVDITSDGRGKDWKDGAMLCQQFLGYGQNFVIDDEEVDNKKDEQVKSYEEAEFEE